jgi:hypothetical protein
MYHSSIVHLSAMADILTDSDLALLRRYEPVLRFNRGEQFYPMSVEQYIRSCALCVRRPNEVPQVIIPRGRLTPEALAEPLVGGPGTVYYLHFVDPLSPAEVKQFRSTSSLREFHAGRGRLARVGILQRFADLVFSVSLLLRGRVPGGAAAAAAIRYHELRAEDARFYYYGRVVRDGGYVALQYWFFYAFNDWRSSFNGVNDHEADWEMVTVFLADDADGALRPRWLAYSQHEYEGDDLRRRWDDPDLRFVGEHPVVFVGAGGHANYFFPGEYLPTAALPFTGGLNRALATIRRFWHDFLRQGDPDEPLPEASVVRLPFVDYARGDGLAIGPGATQGWEQRVLQPTADAPAPPWLEYRGLWGLFTGDPLEGEDAPARPKYERDGRVHRMWYDPLGWCGLDKTPPPAAAAAALAARRDVLLHEQRELDERIAGHAARLVGLEMELEAIRRLPQMRLRVAAVRRQARQVEQALDRFKRERATNAEVLEELDNESARLARGDYGSPRDHLHAPQLPASTDDLQLSRLAETWSAISIGVLLVGTVALALFSLRWETGLLAMLGIYAFIEALFRRQIQEFVRRITVGLAIIAALVLLYQFFWPVIGVLALFAGLLVIVENVRELRAWR